tara:strand:- start:339 stop:512 length:174 start_codon:yes stop_codon:yes gene_type:complete
MPAVYQTVQKSKYRITLELDVMSDFDPHQLNWEDIFDLEGSEYCEAYVEDLSTPDSW